MFESGFTTWIISIQEIENTIKIVKSLEDSALLIKGFSKNEIKEQKGGYFGMLLDTSGASFLGNLFTGQGKIRIGKGKLEQVKSFNAAQPLTYFEL